MTDGFRADPTELAARAGQLEDLADRATAIHRQLADVLTDVGPCWGGDAIGQSFASVYTGPAGSTLGQLGALPDQLRSAASRFADTAAAYRQHDSAAAQHLASADIPDA